MTRLLNIFESLFNRASRIVEERAQAKEWQTEEGQETLAAHAAAVAQEREQIRRLFNTNVLPALDEEDRALAQQFDPVTVFKGIHAVNMWIRSEVRRSEDPDPTIIVYADGSFSVGQNHPEASNVKGEIVSSTENPQAGALTTWIPRALTSFPTLLRDFNARVQAGSGNIILIPQSVSHAEKTSDDYFEKRWGPQPAVQGQ